MIRSSLMLLGTTALLAIPAYAETPAAVQGEQTAGATDGVQDIVVSARRRLESVQKVPVAVTAVSAKALENQHIFEAFQLPSVAPSLQVQSIAKQVGAVNFSVRGVGTAVFGGQTEASVGVVIDDVVYSRPNMAVFQLFDLDRVEILRGPQGTLFGKNAPAGLVSITSASPKIGQWGGFVNGTLGVSNTATFGLEARTQGALNIPISSTAAARISAFYTRQDGFSKNVFRDDDLGLTEYGVRLKLRWQPAPSLTVDLSGDYVKENGPGGSLLIRRTAPAGGFYAGLDTAAGITSGPNNLNIASDGPSTFNFEAGGGQGTIAYSFDNGLTLTNIAAYRTYKDHVSLDSDLTPVDFANENEGRRQFKQFSNELRLSSPAGDRFSYQAGLYYLHLKATDDSEYGVNVRPLFPAPPPPFRYTLGSLTSAVARNTSIAGFAEGQFKVTPALNLTAGIRYTRDKIDYSYVVTKQSYTASSIFALGSVGGHATTKNISYRVGIDYTIAPDVLAYATYSRGYKGPTFDGVTASPVKREIARNIELGLKSTLFDRKLRLNIALFQTVFDGYQAQVQDPNLVGRFITLNAGDLKSRGVEIEFTATPAEGLTIGGGVTYNLAKYRNFAGVPCYFVQPTGTSGRNVCLPTGVTDVSGNQLQNAPKWSVTFNPRYEHPLHGAIGFIQADYSYRSDFYFTATRNPTAHVDGYSLVGGSLGVMTPNRMGEVSFFVRNLFDKRVPTYILADTLSVLSGDDKKGGGYWQSFGTSSFRTIGVAASYRF
jgi:iron complex outermembrane receptor protein